MSMKPGQFVRHGDVILIMCDENDIPAGATVASHDQPVEGKQAVAAYGEVTGHRHLITAGEGTEVTLFEIPGLKNASELASGRVGNRTEDGLLADRFLKIVNEVESPEAAVITHEEHNTINLPTGTFRVRIQKEYAPDRVRNVAD